MAVEVVGRRWEVEEVVLDACVVVSAVVLVVMAAQRVVVEVELDVLVKLGCEVESAVVLVAPCVVVKVIEVVVKLMVAPEEWVVATVEWAMIP